MISGDSQLGTWLLALAGFCCDHVCEEAGVDDPLHQAPPSLHELRLRRVVTGPSLSERVRTRVLQEAVPL